MCCFITTCMLFEIHLQIQKDKVCDVLIEIIIIHILKKIRWHKKLNTKTGRIQVWISKWNDEWINNFKQFEFIVFENWSKVLTGVHVGIKFKK